MAGVHRVLPVQSPRQKPVFRLLRKQWSGENEEARPTFRLVLGNGRLRFLVKVAKSPAVVPAAAAGVFFEGLWEADCAEVFLADPVTGFYLEVNLAPNGAWWTCLFDGPRMRALSENLPLDGVVATGRAGRTDWEAAWEIGLADLPPQIPGDPRRLRGNVTFSLGSEPHQRFLSWADLGGGMPDFHQPERFLPLG